MGTLHGNQYTFLIKSRSVLLRMRNVSDKSCRENRNTRFVFNNRFPKSYLLWANVETCCTAGQATWQYGALVLHVGLLRLQTQNQNIKLVAFLLQQWLQERIRTLPFFVSLRFLNSTMYASSFPPVHTTWLTHPILLDFINLIIFVED